MGKIVAIGGGEIGRPGYPVETTKIDKEIIRLSGKKRPRLLFIPTASGDAEDYIKSVEKHFGQRLGCKVDTLLLVKTQPNKKEIRDKIFGADIIYVGGGNTLKIMNRWRQLGVDKLLIEAHRRGIVMSGLSAGAICWFKYGLSDSRKFNNKTADFIRVAGLGLINALCCPHYDIEKARPGALRKMMKRSVGVAIALDNCAALEVVDGRYRIIASKRGKRGYEIYWKGRKRYEKSIGETKKFIPTAKLANNFLY